MIITIPVNSNYVQIITIMTQFINFIKNASGKSPTLSLSFFKNNPFFGSQEKYSDSIYTSIIFSQSFIQLYSNPTIFPFTKAKSHCRTRESKLLLRLFLSFLFLSMHRVSPMKSKAFCNFKDESHFSRNLNKSKYSTASLSKMLEYLSNDCFQWIKPIF